MAKMKHGSVFIIPKRLHPFRCGSVQRAILCIIREYKAQFPWRNKVPLRHILHMLPNIPEETVLDALKRLENRGFVKLLRH